LNALFEAASEVCAFMEARQWKYCIIGGLAVQQWGEPRTTLDVDLTLLTGWGEEAQFVDALLERFKSRLDGAREFALARRILLIRASNGTDLDVALGALPFEENMVARARPVAFSPDLQLPCCMAEDLVIMKVFAGRPRDWLDAESIVARQCALDAAHILGHLAQLCELTNNAEALERARRMLERQP